MTTISSVRDGIFTLRTILTSVGRHSVSRAIGLNSVLCKPVTPGSACTLLVTRRGSVVAVQNGRSERVCRTATTSVTSGTAVTFVFRGLPGTTIR